MGIEFDGNINNIEMRTPYKPNIIEELKNLDKSKISEIGKMLGEPRSQNVDDALIEILIKGGYLKKPEPTPEEKEALEQLNKKVSSTGISYGDATAKINEIREKYNDDKYFTEVMVEEKPSEFLIYKFPVKKKVFDGSKLPEPARTEYREAMEAKEEIENNNSALVKKAGIDKAPVYDNKKSGYDSGNIPDVLKKLVGAEPELTEKQKAARAKLDEKQSSTGVKYKDAKAVIDQLTEKYKDSCKSMFESEQSKIYAIYKLPYEAFDPYKIPEPDKTAYFEALAAITEIEQQNSALLQQGGLSRTPQPNQNYATRLKHF